MMFLDLATDLGLDVDLDLEDEPAERFSWREVDGRGRELSISSAEQLTGAVAELSVEGAWGGILEPWRGHGRWAQTAVDHNGRHVVEVSPTLGVLPRRLHLIAGSGERVAPMEGVCPRLLGDLMSAGSAADLMWRYVRTGAIAEGWMLRDIWGPGNAQLP